MSEILLQTKLYIPPPRPGNVPRSRLTEALNAGIDSKLTLVSAPAGFGKTTLVSEWLSQSPAGIHVAWLSLDRGDDDPARFLAYMIGALQIVHPTIGQELMPGSPLPPLDSAMTMLINDIAAESQSFILVLDDYHLITTTSIHQAIAYLIDHMPPQMHLAIISRSDPPFSLSRLRVRRQLTEIRARDLRFTLPESTDFLDQTMALALSTDQVALLAKRTEGWIVGLQLAAHSLKLEDDKSSFLTLFAGDDRYIADYLLEEVLAHQPETIQSFLLQTSVLDRLCAPLCDVVLERQDSQSVLDFLERSNLFVVPLDTRRQWYRYHHLFVDLLRERLVLPIEEKNRLNRRAGRWYAGNGFSAQAIDHAISATDYDEALERILQSSIELFSYNRFATLTKWLRQIPDGVKEKNPSACVMAAWAWLAFGQWQESERCLRIVERALGASTDALLATSDTLSEGVRNGLIEVAVIRMSRQTVAPADVDDILALCHYILPFLVEGDQPHLFSPPIALRSVVLFNMALAHQALGELDAARIDYGEAIAAAEATANIEIGARGSALLAGIESVQGRLYQAAETCRRGIELLTRLTGRVSSLSGLLQIQLGQLHYEWNDLNTALRHFQAGIELAKSWHVRETLLPGYLGLVLAYRALADDQGARAAQEALDDIVSNDPQSATSIVSANTGWLLSQLTDLQATRRWSRIMGLPSASEPLGQPQAILLVRQQFLQGEFEHADRLVATLLESAEYGEQWRSVVELLVLQATILDARGNRTTALETLSRAVDMAAPQGYVRTFVDGGEPIARLLLELVRSSSGSKYVSHILAAFPPQTKGSLLGVEPVPSYPAIRRHLAELVDPLSDRELEVLQLIAEGLSNKEIAARLYLSPGTVKVHAHNIYGKMGVSGRTQAVAKARTLGILP